MKELTLLVVVCLRSVGNSNSGVGTVIRLRNLDTKHNI